MKLYVAYDEIEEEVIGIFSSAEKRLDAVLHYFGYMDEDPNELAITVENDITLSTYTLDERFK